MRGGFEISDFRSEKGEGSAHRDGSPYQPQFGDGFAR